MADNRPPTSPHSTRPVHLHDPDRETIARVQEEEQLRLIADLLPSPPAHPLDHRHPWSGTSTSAISNTMADAKTRKRIVTVDDLKNKVCWICQEGEEEEEAATSAATGPGVNTAPPRNDTVTPLRASARRDTIRAHRHHKRSKPFVHPCRCTLVAHEQCLLAWIHQKKTPISPQVKCPQCSEPFALESPRPLILRLFEIVDRSITAATPKAGIGAALGASLFLSGAFGLVALRLWMGKTAAQRWLGHRGWSPMIYAGLPTIAPLLIASRVNFVSNIWRGSVAYFIYEQAVLLNLYGTVDVLPLGQSSLFSYPPSPRMTILLQPTLRSIYFAIRRRLTEWLLAPFVKKTSASASRRPGPGNVNGEAAEEARNARRAARQSQVIFIGGEGHHLLDADMEQDGPIAPGAQAIANDDIRVGLQADVGDQEGLLEEHEVFDGLVFDGAGQREGRTIYVTPMTLCKTVLEALSFPVIAAGMGELLGVLASSTRPGSTLEKFLGITDQTRTRWRSQRGAQSPKQWLGPSTTAAEVFPHDSLGRFKSWALDKITALQGYAPEDVAQSQNKHTQYQTNGGVSYLDEMDVERYSVHWRNTLGFYLYVILSDGCWLGYRYLKLRQRTRTRVVDRPFEGEELIRGLDLK